MDRLFLDANVLFSAAYSPRSGLLKLWELPDVLLCTSRYALKEARTNLSKELQRDRLSRLAVSLRFVEATQIELPSGIVLPEKDVPILLGAIASQASHLITGDLRHFGPYFGKKVSGVLVLPPAQYLRGVR